MSNARLTTKQYNALNAKRAKTKYGNTQENGRASKKENRRAEQLNLMQQAGEIYGLKEQVSFELIPEQHGPDGRLLERACNYVADAVYKRAPDDVQVVEDCKGYRTAEYRIKRKLFLFRYGFPITEV